jgi:hypothetical protein
MNKDFLVRISVEVPEEETAKYNELREAAIGVIERKGNFQCEHWRRLMRAVGGYGKDAER